MTLQNLSQIKSYLCSETSDGFPSHSQKNSVSDKTYKMSVPHSLWDGSRTLSPLTIPFCPHWLPCCPWLPNAGQSFPMQGLYVGCSLPTVVVSQLPHGYSFPLLHWVLGSNGRPSKKGLMTLYERTPTSLCLLTLIHFLLLSTHCCLSFIHSFPSLPLKYRLCKKLGLIYSSYIPSARITPGI